MKTRSVAEVVITLCLAAWTSWSAEKGGIAPGTTMAGSHPGDLSVPHARCANTGEAPVIDGRLDEPCWRLSVELGPFVQMASGELPGEGGRGYLLHDEKHLFIGVECDESLLDERLQRTHEIKRERKRRDSEVYSDDCVELFLQPDPAQGTYFHLVINSLGTLYDARCGQDGSTDSGWNSGARIAVSADQKTWRVEMAIPWSDVGLEAKDGASFRFNICRREYPNQEVTIWSPTGNDFHSPDMFGVVALGGAALGQRKVSPPDLSEGEREFSMCLTNPGGDGQMATMAAMVRYGEGDWGSHAKTVTIPPGGEVTGRILCQLDAAENLCFFLDAPTEKANDTLCLRTGFLPVKADTEYVVSAMVRAENLTGGSRPLVLSLSSVNTAGMNIASYEEALDVPTGTYGWRRIQGRWRSAPTAAKILFWAVKWAGSGVTGKVWIDDLRVCPVGSSVSILPNGAVEKDADGMLLGWPIQLGWTVSPSYDRGTQAEVALQLYDETGALLCSSPVAASRVIKQDLTISSSLMLLSSLAESSDMVRIRSLHAVQGGYLHLPMVFRSSVREKLAGCRLTLEVPTFLSLVDPAPRATILKSESTTRQGEPYNRYELTFPAESLSPAEAKKETTVINQLLFSCEIAPGATGEWRLFHTASAGGKTEPELETPLFLLPPLGWKRPANVIINNWACSSFYLPLRALNEQEVDLVARTFRLAGFNQIGKPLGTTFIQKYGFQVQGGIPLINSPGNLFPESMKYLAAHPEAWALDFSGKRDNTCFCPTYFLSEENKHLTAVEKWLEKEAMGVAMLDWDYEVPVTRPTSICLCDRCLTEFRGIAGIPPDEELTAKGVLEERRQAWVDFRCRQNAEIAGLFRRAIKRGNPECVFSVYSGYQGPTDEQYGVDWRYMSKYCDLVWCGYGRSPRMIAATRKAIGDRPFIGGELAWYGSSPYDHTNIKPILFRRLADCGSGIMVFFNWIVDGRFYEAVSAVAGLAADFEPFFCWDKDDEGFLHSHYRRDDTLVETAGEGLKDDVAVLTHGKERLVWLFNESKASRRFQVNNLSWEAGMACVDYLSKEVAGAEITVDVPAHDVRVLHIVEATQKDEVKAPEPMSAEEQERLKCYPLLAWRGKGSRPGDQLYTVEISQDQEFPPGETMRTENIASTIHVIRDGLKAGERYLWRVQGRDPVTGKSGPYSAAVSFRVPLFTDVRVWPTVLNPELREPVQGHALFIQAALPEAMKWSVRFSDSAGKVVRTITGGSGLITLAWDGKDGDGQPCADGTYLYTIAAETFPDSAVSGQLEINSRSGLKNPTLAICREFRFANPEGSVKLENDYLDTNTHTYSIRMTADAPKGTAYWSNYCNGGVEPKAAIPVTPGKMYTFRAWVKSDLSSGEGMISLAFFTGDGRWAVVPGQRPWGTDCEKVEGKSDWTERSVTLAAPENAQSAVLFFRVKDARGSCLFDDVSFEESE